MNKRGCKKCGIIVGRKYKAVWAGGSAEGVVVSYNSSIRSFLMVGESYDGHISCNCKSTAMPTTFTDTTEPKQLELFELENR